MKPKLCVLYIGLIRTFFEIENEHSKFIDHYKDKFDIDVFCVVSDNLLSHDFFEKINRILSPKSLIYASYFEQEYTNLLSDIKNNEYYQKNLQYVNSLEDDVVGRQELPQIIDSQVRQFLYLKKGIIAIEEYEHQNNIKYDIFVKTRFDFVMNDFYDLSIVQNTNVSIDDLLCGGSNSYLRILEDAKKFYKITTNYEYLKFLKDLSIDHYASRFYTQYPVDLNLGGRYIKNYDTVNDICQMNQYRHQIDNIIYFVNDWFFFTKRKNMDILKNFVASYGQNKLDDLSGNHVLAPEYQLFAYCKLHNLLPIIHLNTKQGGIFRDNISLFDGNIIPVGKQFILNGCNGSYDGEYISLLGNGKNIIMKFLIYYSYYGEEVDISFNTDCQRDIKMNFIIEHHSGVFQPNHSSHIINKGEFSHKFKCDFYGKFMIKLEFVLEKDELLRMTMPKIKHTEINLTIMSFFTCGPPYDNAYDLTKCDSQLRELSNKYADSYISVRMHDLDNPDDKQFISLNCDAKKQIGTIININVEKIAYFKWKPHVVLKYARQLPDNHILMYRDGNITKYTSYLKSFNTIKRQVTHVMSTINEPLFMAYENHAMKSIFHQKKYLSDFIGVNQNEFFANHNLISAATIICRKTAWSLSFLEEWENNCTREDLINLEHIDPTKEDFRFRWHCNDQAIMNAMVIKKKQNNEIDMNYPYYIYNLDRFFDCNNFMDIRDQKQYNGFVLNKMQLVTNYPQTSCGAILYRTQLDTLHFKRSSSSTAIGNQWVGYQIFRNRVNTIKFQIKFINFIPKQHPGVGFKVHIPVSVTNNWIQDCVVNQWKDVNIIIEKICDEFASDLAILIFDHAEPNTEFELRNFNVS